MAHVRRKFFAALETSKVLATEAIEQILGFYEVEYMAAEQGILGTERHLALRKTLMKERFDNFKVWLDNAQAQAPPKSPMGKAIGYALGQWPYLQEVLRNLEVRLDNNLAENALRLIALGRKNFLFVGSDDAGENLAVLQTIVATCVANNVNPETYIADVLLRLTRTKADDIDSLLPENWRAATANQSQNEAA